jgi:hypothetical protein
MNLDLVWPAFWRFDAKTVCPSIGGNDGIFGNHSCGVATMTATTKVAAAVLCLQACISPILSLPMQVTVNQRAVECLYDKVEKE